MKFTISWLKEYLDTNQDPDIICQKLTDIGLEVEEVENEARSLEIFTVAKIINAAPHQDSDNLQICTVDVGSKESLQIICGASNARTGIKVIYAPIGSVIPTNNMKIKKSKIRGVESFGMLCSAAELGIGTEGEGIVEIDDKFEIGTKVTQVYNLNEVVIDLNITPNRGDCLGVYGIARDLASAGLGTLKALDIKDAAGNFDSQIKVNIAHEAQSLCPYFAGYQIKNITNQESPKWLKEKLEAVGVNSINCVVDITNYVMYCLNQPLHAYGADKIKGNINVRVAKEGEKFTSLKEIEYNLNGSELLICDDEKIAGLAGIMGGSATTTLEDTKDIFLEGAFFEGTNVARSGRKLKIISDARYRFERNTDIKAVKRSLNLAANLIVEICGGEVSKIVEAGSDDVTLNKIDFNLSKIKSVLNVNIEAKEVITILDNLGFAPKDSGQGKLQVTIPSFRSDVKIEEDIIEEVIRIYGYDKIESRALDNVQYQPVDQKFNYNELRRDLCNLGIDEIISWSFIDSKIASNFTQIQEKLIVSNAISEEMNYMRPSLIPGLICTLQKNQSRGFFDLSLFEIGKIFLDTDISGQIDTVSCVRVGKNKNKNHYKDERLFDVMDIKKDLFTTLETLGVNPKSVQIISGKNSDLPSYYHPYKSAVLRMGKNIIGHFGEVHPIINKKLSVKGKINAFELFTNKLPQKKNKFGKKAFMKSDFQTVNRDFAFILDKETQIADLIKLVKNSDQELINEVSIFDIYEGDNIENNKKSIAFNVEIVPKLKTLDSDDIEELSNKIINVVCDKLNGTLRDN
jgi:phenylalanyl-tRNA synthetase beta chain